MSLSLRLCFIIAASVGWIGKCKSDPGLELPTERVTGLGCIPEGRNVSYQCTLLDNGVGSTVWLGSAFTCSSADKITLNHFEYPGAMGICGNFSAMSVNFTAGVEYTSRLTFTATAALNGAVIECTLSTQAFSNDTVKIGALPPPPGPLMVTLSSDSSLTVSWSPPSGPVEGGVGGYVFGVTGEECGCMSMNVSGDTTSVMCSGWTAAGQTCSFEVRTLSQDCGFTSEPVNETISLTVPSSPNSLMVKPEYYRQGQIKSITVEFMTMNDNPFISSTINNTVSYTVTLGAQLFTGLICKNNCSFEVNGSLLTVSGLFNVSVVASNAVGKGEPVIFPMSVAANTVSQDIARVDVDVQANTVYCVLLSSYRETPNVTCSITYGPTTSCSRYTNSSSLTMGRPNTSLSVSVLTPSVGKEFCYTVELPHGDTLLSISGSFRSACDPSVLGDNPSSQNGSGTVTVLNGLVNYADLIPGSVAILMCNPGYRPESSLNRTCGSDGLWNENKLSCQQIFQPPASSACGSTCIIVVAVVVFSIFLVLMILCLVIALCLCQFRRKGQKKVISEEAVTHVCREETPKPADTYPDPDDLLQTPQLPPRNYEGVEEAKTPVSKEEANTGELKYVSVDTLGFSTMPLKEKKWIEDERVNYSIISVATSIQ